MLKEELLLEVLKLIGQSGTVEDSRIPNAEVARKVRPVVVFTDKRGIFFGYTDDDALGNVKLRNARNCHYWGKQTSDRQSGFLGLANHGPADGSKIGVSADIELTGVTCIAECTEEAAKKWEESTWVL